MPIWNLPPQLKDWFKVPGDMPAPDQGATQGRPALTHVIVLDGTMSSLTPGCETNAGLTYRLLKEQGGRMSVYYEPGLQWSDWRAGLNVLRGRGINKQIKRAYGYLASRYRPGDRIFLLGYSRGAFGVRSLAGVIDRVGLLNAACATQRNVRTAYRHYRRPPDPVTLDMFREESCHKHVPIEMIGVWDTVKSLGINAPVLWRLSVAKHAFHNHDLGMCIKNGFHALAHDETRVAYGPILWNTTDANGQAGGQDRVEQVWFPGTHGDVGGHLMGFNVARPLANIPLVWLLARAEECGLPLPKGWNLRFEQDATAPSVGRWRGYAGLLVTRRKRLKGRDPSERLHESIAAREKGRPKKNRFSYKVN